MGDEGSQFGGPDRRTVGDLSGVEVQEQVAGVPIEFRMLAVQHGVLDRERVQPEFLRHDAEIRLIGTEQV